MNDGDLRRLFRKHLPEVFWTSVESRLTQQGIPDLFGIYQSVPFWIENKKAKHWRVRLRPMQIGWLLHYSRAGGRCFVAVRSTDGDNLWLVPGHDAAKLAGRGLAGLDHWRGGPMGWQWRDILVRLCRA